MKWEIKIEKTDLYRNMRIDKSAEVRMRNYEICKFLKPNFSFQNWNFPVWEIKNFQIHHFEFGKFQKFSL